MAKNKKDQYWKDITPLIIIGILFLIASILIIGCGPEWIIKNRMAAYKAADANFTADGSGALGDTFGGALGPLVGLLASFLTFLAFWIQYRANQVQKLQFERQSQDAIFFKALDDLQSKIEHASFEGPNGQTVSYNVLPFLVKQYRDIMDDNISPFSRNLICENPVLADYLFFAKAYEPKLFASLDFEILHQDFLSNMYAKDKNDRWEYLKHFVSSVGAENTRQLDALRSLGSVNYYRLPFKKRFNFYKLIFQIFTKNYGAFVDGYYINIEFILSFIEDSINPTLYIRYLKSRLSQYDLVLLFYYLVSGYGSDKMYNLVNQYQIFDQFHKYNGHLMDGPSKEQIEQELAYVYSIPYISLKSHYSRVLIDDE